MGYFQRIGAGLNSIAVTAKGRSATQANPYVIFAVVALALLMSSIDATIVAVGLPTMLTDLRTNLALLGWVLTGYQLTQTIVMPLAGKLSDEIGRKRLFLLAVVTFTASSLAAGFAPNIYLLIVFRVAQAIGGGVFLPSATGIVSDAFGKRRRTAIGLFSSIFPLGGVIGPNIGGLIIDHLSWRWIFFVNVPIGIALIVLGSAILPSQVRRAQKALQRRQIDFLGAGLFAAAMFSILFAMSAWANSPEQAASPVIGAAMAIGLALMGAFVYHEARTAAPVMELKLLTWRPFLAANVYNFIFGAVVFGFFSFIPYYATVAYGMDATGAGAILTPRSLAMVAMSTASSFLLIRLGYRLPMVLGVLLISASMFLLGQGYHGIHVLGLAVPSVALLVVMVMMGGMGMGVGSPASNNAALDLLPEKVAAATGLRGMFRATGGVLGTAAVVLALSHYQDKAAGLRAVFVFLSFALLLAIPCVFMIPDTARSRRLEKGKAVTEGK